jgi:hypothetical protein
VFSEVFRDIQGHSMPQTPAVGGDFHAVINIQ